jgi:hypothetical protein
MIAWQFAEELPVGRVRRGMRVGPWSADVLCDRPLAGIAPPSGEVLRLAEDLLCLSQGLDAGSVRVAALAPSGRPVATVAGTPVPCAVSVSHVRGLAGAVVSDNACVGIDIVDPADAGRSLDVWFTPDELALLPDDHGLLRAMLWAAKEAAYKAARLDTEFRPRMVVIESLSANAFKWRVRDGHAEVDGEGCFATLGRYVVAIAATPLRAAGGGVPCDVADPFTATARFNQGVSA